MVLGVFVSVMPVLFAAGIMIAAPTHATPALDADAERGPLHDAAMVGSVEVSAQRRRVRHQRTGRRARSQMATASDGAPDMHRDQSTSSYQFDVAPDWADAGSQAQAPRARRNGRAALRAPTRERAERATPAARESARDASASANAGDVASAGAGSHGLVSEARRWLGTNPTGRRALWCARFMNFVLERSGHRGSGSDMARSFASYGTRVSGPQVGSIAVLSRGRGGGHVGVVTGVDGSGNPIIISGNHGRRVGEAAYPRGRVHAYVTP